MEAVLHPYRTKSPIYHISALHYTKPGDEMFRGSKSLLIIYKK